MITKHSNLRSTADVAGAPLLPFVKRLSEIKCGDICLNKDDDKEDNPNIHIFLELLELPEDDSLEVDLKQAAVYTMTYLDKLVTPFLPAITFFKVNMIYECSILTNMINRDTTTK